MNIVSYIPSMTQRIQEAGKVMLSLNLAQFAAGDNRTKTHRDLNRKVKNGF